MTVVAAMTVVVFAGAGCAPRPTALEKYCDIVQQSEAAFDPFSTPGAVTDPTVLAKAIGDQLTTANALAEVAPEVVRADAATIRQGLIKISNALAAKRFDASQIEGDPAVAVLLAEATFLDARRRLQDFNGAHCA
jgi:hypothetical protein